MILLLWLFPIRNAEFFSKSDGRGEGDNGRYLFLSQVSKREEVVR